MAQVILIVAVIFEVGWAVGLKFTEGFTRVWPSILTVCAMVISMALLGVAVRTLPLGTTYAVWTGIGTAGTVLLEGRSRWANPPLLCGSCSGF